MLSDSDRIFTNLYGAQDWGLDSARARGDWDGTAALIEPRATTGSSIRSRSRACAGVAAPASRPD